MARYRILSWHHIPAVVEASDETSKHKEELSARFPELIDRVAMRHKLVGTDAYLEGWRRSRPKTRDGDAKMVAKAVAAELEDGYAAIANQDL